MQKEELQKWLVSRVAEYTSGDGSAIGLEDEFDALGLESIDLVEISGELEELLDRRIDPTLLYEYPSVAALVAHFSSETLGDRSEKTNLDAKEPIAIVGLSCRVPGANGKEDFWRLLSEGEDPISEVPPDRWSIDELYDREKSVPGKMNSRCGGFLLDPDGFDNKFFAVSSAEAEAMDPQQRLLMEVTWEAFEDANILPSTMSGSNTGVFIGISHNDSEMENLREAEALSGFSGTGNALSVAANRISYRFDFRGPSMSVDTACSSSLVAVHLAVNSIRSGDCSAAVVGGVNLIFRPEPNIIFSKAGMMATDGRCKVFDDAADGYVRGEGCGVVVLKPLKEALAEGNRIYATIRGSAVGQDGRTNGLSAPNPGAQKKVIESAFEAAGVSPGDAIYFETHGTGTKVGDPIELSTLARVIFDNGQVEKSVFVGALKSNIGHLESAAGIAGLIKAALVLYQRKVTPNLHLKKLNSLIEPYEDRFIFPSKVENLPCGEIFAGVSAFGFGGTNSHVVLQSNESESHRDRWNEGQTSEVPEIILFSGASMESLRSNQEALASWLEDGTHFTNIRELGFTLATGREHLRYRKCGVVGDVGELRELLFSVTNGSDVGHVPDLGLVFSGHGSQFEDVCLELLDYPTFAQSLRRSEEILLPLLGDSILRLISRCHDDNELEATEKAQPVITALGIALTDFLRDLGVQARFAVGHSVGEIGAAYACGYLSQKEALELAFQRGQSMKNAPRGAMISVEASREGLESQLEANLEIVGENAPRSFTVAGPQNDINLLIEKLKAEQVPARRTRVSYQFHSKAMKDVSAHFKDNILPVFGEHGISANNGVNFYSGLTGKNIDVEPLDSNYWADCVKRPVKFRQAVDEMLSDGCSVFIEIGGDAILSPYLRRQVGSKAKVISLLKRTQNGKRSFLSALAELYRVGVNVNWENLFPRETRQIDLPTYQWSRTSSATRKPVKLKSEAWQNRNQIAREFSGVGVPSKEREEELVWLSKLDLKDFDWLRDHVVAGATLFPATAYIELSRRSANDLGLQTGILSNLSFENTLTLNGAETVWFLVKFLQTQSGWDVLVLSRKSNSDSWLQNFSAKISSTSSPEIDRSVHQQISSHELSSLEWLASDDLYKKLDLLGLKYGSAFRKVEHICRLRDSAVARLDQSRNVDTESEAQVTLLDAAMHGIASEFEQEKVDNKVWVPRAIRSLYLERSIKEILFAEVVVVDGTAKKIIADVNLRDGNGDVVGYLEKVEFVQIFVVSSEGDEQQLSEGGKYHLYTDVWEEVADPLEDSEPQNWLILSDRSEEICSPLRKRIESTGGSCIIVSQGIVSPSERATAYVVDPNNPEDIEKLVDRITSESGTPIDQIVCLWGTDKGDEKLERRNTLAVTALVRSLAFGAAVSSPRLWLVTKGAQKVGSRQKTVDCESAVSWGLGLAIAFEHPDLKCCRLDLDLNENDLSDELIRLMAGQMRGDQFADRLGALWQRRLVEIPLDSVSNSRSIRKDGTYIITGGLGAIGKSLASELAELPVDRIVLMGRSPANSNDLSAIKAMVDKAVQVENYVVDVSKYEDLDLALDKIRSYGPPIRGIFHAAGVLEDAPIVDVNRRMIENVFAPKILGLRNFEKLTLSDPIDHFVLFSSASATLGSLGQSVYMAANNFLGAWAERRSLEGKPALCVEWGPWDEAGMAVDALQDGKASAALAGVSLIQHKEGINLLLSLLRTDRSRLMILPYDLKTLIPIFPAASGIAVFEKLFGEDFHQLRNEGISDAVSARPSLSVEFKEPETKLEIMIAGIWQRALNMDRIGVQDPFFELGGDSVFAGQILTQINRTLGVNLESESAFENFTVETLADLAEKAIFERIESLTEEEVTEHLNS